MQVHVQTCVGAEALHDGDDAGMQVTAAGEAVLRGDVAPQASADVARKAARHEREGGRVVARAHRQRAAGYQPPSLRVGRVLAMPGDRVAFHVPGAALGLAIDGIPLTDKATDPLRLRLDDGNGEYDPEAPAKMRTVAYETTGARRFSVLPGLQPTPGWSAMALPPLLAGPVEIEAEGYLVLADHRDARIVLRLPRGGLDS